VEQQPSLIEPLAFEGFMFREYLVGRFSIGGDGIALGKGLTPLPKARMTFEARVLKVEITLDAVRNALTPWIGGSWSYHEFEHAQVFEAPRWARVRGLSPDEYPVGVRLHLGESRPALLFFTTPVDAVLEALERHRVRTERTPIKLNAWLIGRK